MNKSKILGCLILIQVLYGCTWSNPSEVPNGSKVGIGKMSASTSVIKVPTKVIFDSDASSDWDDVGDIAVLNSMADLGDVEILAAMASSKNGATALFLNSINTWYGRPNIPVGRRPDIGGSGGYPAQIANEYPHPLYANITDPPLAANLYRKVLAAQPDNSVVIITTGYLNNLQALLQSGPDAYSPLSGSDLVAQKVKYWSNAGGDFPSGGEFNFTVEPAAAEYVVNNWPAGAVNISFRLGGAIFSGWNLGPNRGLLRRSRS
jgi:purine nucleosidase